MKILRLDNEAERMADKKYTHLNENRICGFKGIKTVLLKILFNLRQGSSGLVR